MNEEIAFGDHFDDLLELHRSAIAQIQGTAWVVSGRQHRKTTRSQKGLVTPRRMGNF
jgi:hypothetical protein